MFSEYLKTEGINLTEFAARIGCDVTTLSKISTGSRQASPKLARRIDEATHGKISRRALRPDIFESPANDDTEPHGNGARA